MTQIAHVLGASIRSIKRWKLLFRKYGLATRSKREKRASRWPVAVCDFVLKKKYLEDHPCFYLEELQDTLQYKFGNIKLSTATICMALRFDLGLCTRG
ncbi:hypothetical protein F441_11693 [Phytophthora nicotianae CJ01A1]|nr:hypothetical protein F441_11693 [Phytophthora nicotianae CJ01A1]